MPGAWSLTWWVGGLCYLIHKLCIMVSLTSQGSWANPPSRGRKIIREGENMVQSRAMYAGDCCLKGRGRVRRERVEARAQASVWA